MKLFGKDTKGGIKEWAVEVHGSEIHVTHGKMGGKMQLKVTKCEGKNIGRSNETTPEEQAKAEAVSKYKKQLDKNYRSSIEELESVGNNLPMLAHDYTRVGHRMHFPCHVSPKLDGVRCLARITPTTVTLTSRGGKEYPIPSQIANDLMELCNISNNETLVLDGELYIHEVSLQNIVSAVKSPDNPLHSQVGFHIFDIPSDKSWVERFRDLIDIRSDIDYMGRTSLRVVGNVLVKNEREARGYLQQFMNCGYEGLMLRDLEAPYKFNHRSVGLMKWKEFQDVEAKIISVREDKLGEGVLTCELQNGVRVDCKLRGSHDYRKVEVQRTLIGAWITIKFQQYTDDGVPQFPVGVCVRECDEMGYPIV